MRRDSEPALTLVKLAEDNGLDIDGMRLETWSQGGMLWPDGTPDERQLEYLRLLVRLTGHRKSLDRAAQIMAVHGCPVERLRSALSLGGPDPRFQAILDSGDKDAIADAIEDTVDEYMDSPLGDGTFNRPTTDRLTSASLGRAKSASEIRGRDETDWQNIKERAISDGASPKEAKKIADRQVKPDAPEVVRRRVGRQLMQALVTGAIDDPDIVEDFIGVDGPEIVDTFISALPTWAAEVNELVDNMPLDELSTICQVTRTTLTPDQLPPEFGRFFNKDLGEDAAKKADDDLAAFAARKAPGDFVLIRHRLRTFAEQCGLKRSLADAGIRDVYGLPISDEDRENVGLLAPTFLPPEADSPT